jgi:hypothetical protein
MKEAEYEKQLLLQKIDANRQVFRLEREAVGHALAPITELAGAVTSLYSHSGSLLRSVYALLKVGS